jgi:transcriptional regulator with XRE-family HTH domain
MLSIGSAALSAASKIGVLPLGGRTPAKASTVTKALSGAHAISEVADSLRSLGQTPTHPAKWERTGNMLRELREQAGLTLAEVGRAVNLKDPELLATAEKGRAGLPFEILLRLASVLGRNDPVSAAISMTRTANPQLWETLETLGFGKLMLQSAREREFVNILRAEDRVRQLSDDDFSGLLAFVKASFELAMAYRHHAG